jgi:hypothetical protein
LSILIAMLYVAYAVGLSMVVMHTIKKKIVVSSVKSVLDKFTRQKVKINRDMQKYISVSQGDEVQSCIKIILHHF